MMENRAQEYIHTQLAAHGWVLTTPQLAAIISPALYGGGQSTLGLMGGLSAEMSRLKTQPYKVLFKDGSEAMCWSRSPASLAQRIEWMTGIGVEVVEPVDVVQEPQRSTLRAADRERSTKADQLRKLASQEPPTHECRLRDEILSARAEIKGMK